ncbi:replication-associated protein [McMurdo Ice Shelf pond-associated circular DNA virus-3]|uniref:Replication-associated protein n=1 Tax=McMurdo Ice Shelf pond-associated circular DNA virus-3 TaxID=1521387 RepID=A0A075LZE1_9VIRU|nr:replication-associated protein [McMurdo Ice Shelf pond-associated circular DNA virus-3]AIF71507.1 replication-associated protein [McMurdo Ice Shelf pond-associated circular DNA virus-3]
MSKNRNFVFTWNNYSDASKTYLSTLACKYVAYAEEVAPTTGTRHLQGFIAFTNAKTIQQARSKLPGCHVETMNGSIAQSEDYCSKAGTLTEHGTKPISNDNNGRAEKLRWQRARDFAKEGKLDEIDADIFIRCYSTLKRIKSDYATKPQPIDPVCIWIYGPTGTGKSHAVETRFPNCYKKCMDDLKWFDGYAHEDAIYLEDIDKYQVKWGGILKRLADRWPMQASIKGAMAYIRPKFVLVTSNYRIDEIWTDPQTLEPLQRRFTEIEKLTQEQVIDFDQ